MPVTVDYRDIIWRLLLTVVAAGLIGLNRSEHGRPAGLRTTMLVGLAAAVAMIQTNLLLDTKGKTGDSFVVMDVMRLPLGILSGMGFIGAGAILRRDNLVLGVTTAATLWLVTVLGLCMGGGQIGLGLLTLALALGILWGLKGLENRMLQERRGTLVLVTDDGGLEEQQVREELHAAGFKIMAWDVVYTLRAQCRELRCDVRWRSRENEDRPPPLVRELAQAAGVRKAEWRPQGLLVPPPP